MVRLQRDWTRTIFLMKKKRIHHGNSFKMKSFLRKKATNSLPSPGCVRRLPPRGAHHVRNVARADQGPGGQAGLRGRGHLPRQPPRKLFTGLVMSFLASPPASCCKGVHFTPPPETSVSHPSFPLALSGGGFCWFFVHGFMGWKGRFFERIFKALLSNETVLNMISPAPRFQTGEGSCLLLPCCLFALALTN